MAKLTKQGVRDLDGNVRPTKTVDRRYESVPKQSERDGKTTGFELCALPVVKNLTTDTGPSKVPVEGEPDHAL